MQTLLIIERYAYAKKIRNTCNDKYQIQESV